MSMKWLTVVCLLFLCGIIGMAQIVPNYQFPDPADSLMKGFRFDVSTNIQYDDNIYYSLPEDEVSAWILSVVPQVSYRKEANKFFIRTQYRGVADIYLDVEQSSNQQELKSQAKYL